MAKKPDIKPDIENRPVLLNDARPWLATREENIRLSALSLAVQSPSANKLKLAREYLNFLMPERDMEG